MEIIDFTEQEKEKFIFLMDKYAEVYKESVQVTETMKELEMKTEELFNNMKDLREQESKIYSDYVERTGESLESAKHKAAKFIIEKQMFKN